MTIHRYTRSQPHPAGFVGLRVVVFCRDSGMLQKWFGLARATSSERKTALREAKKLEARWRKIQRDERRAWHNRRAVHSRGHPLTRTSVCGIRLYYRRRNLESGISYQPCFNLHGEKNGDVLRTTLSIGRSRPLMNAWENAIHRLCDHYSIHGQARADMLARERPTRKQFLALRRELNRHRGHSIPLSVVPEDH